MTDQVEKFVDFLTKLQEREDRAALAALRRGLGKPPGTVMTMFPYVIPHAPEYHLSAYFLLAALFASYPDAPEFTGNLGASFLQLAAETGGDGAQRRFVALLRAESGELPTHLRHAVGLLKAHKIPITWQQLLRDIIAWEHPERSVQQRWGRAFWAATSVSTPSTDDSETTPSATKEDTFA